jgi:arylsulfatase A-like enzyme
MRWLLAVTSVIMTIAFGLAADPRPNILFVIADDWGPDHAGVYGCSWIQTPAFDRVAREGVLFDHCFTNNPKCSPCRASILTGRNTWQLEEACCHFGIFPNKWPVYPDLLEQAGYAVGYTGKGWGPGDFQAGGFSRNPAGPAFQDKKLTPPHPLMAATDYAGNFIDFLAKTGDKPFCFWLGTNEPHRGYEPGIGLRAGKDPAAVKLPAYYPDSPVIRSDYLDYAVEVEWVDRHLGLAIQALEKSGLLENTLIVVTSDHGEPFPRAKGQIYDRAFRIPLAIRWGQKIKPGRRVTDFINVRDFMPTFLEIAGVPIPPSVTGSSFVEVLLSDANGQVVPSRNRIVVGKERHDLGRPNDVGYPVRGIRTTEYLYTRNYEPDRWPVGNPETGYRNCDDSPTKSLLLGMTGQFYEWNFGKRPAEELYRIDRDPDCIRNLADDPSFAAVKARLRSEMEEMLRQDADPRVLGKGAIFDTYKYVGNRAHAYDTWLSQQQKK